jgi:hypothetical protein
MGRAATNFDCPRHQRFVEVKLRAAPAARFLNPSRTVAHNSEYRKQLSLPRPRFDATEIRERLGAGRKSSSSGQASSASKSQSRSPRPGRS